MRENYDLGEVAQIEEVSGGYCNKSYIVWMTVGEYSHPYFLRMYNPGAIQNEILFEHSLLKHLKSNGFHLAAAVIECRNGETVIHTPAPENHRETEAFWALFEYLDGEDKYTWMHTDLADTEFTGAAATLAHLHHCSYGFKKPPGAGRAQPRIMEFLPTFKDRLFAFLNKSVYGRSDRLLKNYFSLVDETIEYAKCFKNDFEGMPEMPIHCDYHPGNLKFAGEKAIGVFDFDWSKIDYRLFDVALALVYFASLWNDQAAGLRPDKFFLFLGTYHQACQPLAHIRPLTAQEQQNLVPMLSIANLYVFNWELVEFYDGPQSIDDEYYRYLDHSIGLLRWIRSNADELETWVDRSLNLTHRK